VDLGQRELTALKRITGSVPRLLGGGVRGVIHPEPGVGACIKIIAAQSSVWRISAYVVEDVSGQLVPVTGQVLLEAALELGVTAAWHQPKRLSSAEAVSEEVPYDRTACAGGK